MTRSGHLWAVGFNDTGRAAQVRDEITKLAQEKHDLVLLDVAVAVRHADGCLTLNGEPLYHVTAAPRGSIAHFLARLALGAPPLCGAAVELTLESAGAGPVETGISGDFIREVECLIQPGTSVLFLLDEVGKIDPILHAIRGLGGTVLKTNVDLERARLIQSTLAAQADGDSPQ
jgi:uncharacterized membrane protein